MFFRSIPRKSWQEKTFERVFKDRKLLEERLIPFGCTRGEKGFLYRAELLDSMLRMEFEIDTDGTVHVTVHGGDGKENETPNLMNETPVSFLGRRLRKEYEDELWHVAECCFEPDVFKNEATRQLIAHIQATYKDEPEFLWRKFPENAIVRRRDNGKWYAAFLVVPRRKLIGNSEERVEILNLRIHPDEREALVDNLSRFPGYHMNKNNWISLCLDGSVPFEELTKRLDTSYRLALK